MNKQSLSQYQYFIFQQTINEKSIITSNFNMQAILSLYLILEQKLIQTTLSNYSILKYEMSQNSLQKYDQQINSQNNYIQNRGSHHFDSSFQQKKTILTSLKNRLQKYDSVEQIPADEIDSLCETVHNQMKSNLESNPSQDQKLSYQVYAPNSSDEQITIDRKGCNNNLYFMKFKQILLITMFVLCIIIKNMMIESNSFDMGQYTVYNTRYNKSMFEIADPLFKDKLTFSSFIKKIFPFAYSQNLIQLYLPKQAQLFIKKNQAEFTYGDCVSYYSEGCIANRLSLYGSISLQLQEWLLDTIKGNQKILFEASLDYSLSIILAVKKLKKYEVSMFINMNKVVLLQNNKLTNLQMNSIKLSLIQNECQDKIIIVKSTSVQELKQFDYIFITQELFTTVFLSPSEYISSTSKSPIFIIYMPQGLNFVAKHIVQSIDNNYVKAIQFSPQQNKKHYKIITYHSGSNNPNDKNYIDTSLTCLLIKKNQVTHLEQVAQTRKIGQRLDNHQIINQQRRSFQLNSHECINPQNYQILLVPLNFKQCVYMSTLLNFKLLVPNSRSQIYKQQGAVSPQLLYFIIDNINAEDTVLFQTEFYDDDLILMALAKKIQNSNHLYCIFPLRVNPQIFLQNMKINSLQNLISYTEIQMEDGLRISNLYDALNFNVIFTSVHYFNRDYFKIYKADTTKIVVFNWMTNPDYVEFFRNILNRHRVWTLIDKKPKQHMGEICNDFDLIQVNENNIISFNGNWMIVQM